MADALDLQETLSQVEAGVARLRKLVDAQAAAGVAETIERALPPEITVPRPEVVATYVGKHPDMLDIVTSLAADLVREFGREPVQIELDQYDDPEIDDHYLTFTVRLPIYPEDIHLFMDHLDRV